MTASEAVPITPAERLEFSAKFGREIVDEAIAEGDLVVQTREQMGVQYGRCWGGR